MNKRLFFLLLGVTAGSLAGQLLVYPRLPQVIPIHWNIEGQIDGWGAKTSNLILAALPLLMLLFLSILPKIDPKRDNYKMHTKAYSIFTTAIVLVFTFLTWVITLPSLGVKLPMFYLFVGMLAIFFIILGNYMPQLRTNYFIGFRTPWTLDNEIVWRKTNRLGGMLFVAGGILMLVLLFLAGPTGAFKGLMALVVGCFAVYLYSYLLYKKIKKSENEEADNDADN